MVALAYVLDGVIWRDYVTLEDGRRLGLVRIDWDANTVTVEQTDGGRTVLPSGSIAVDEQGEPKIEYGLRTAWQKSRKSLLLLAVAVFAPVTILQSLRFLLVFRTQEIVLSYWECIKLCFSGNFLNFATPIGSTAGDVFKAYHVARHTDRKTEALTTILLDRFIGLGVLLLLVGVAIEVGARDPYLRYVGHVINAAIVVAIILVALFFSPLAEMFGGGFEIAPGIFLHPVTAPALVIVGCLMMKCITKIDWDDYSEAIPAFLTVIIMPMTSSIAHGLAIGFISYPLIKALSGHAREVHWLVYSLAALFVLRYIFI